METINTHAAPLAIGPYSQACKNASLVFCSGQIPLKADGTLIDGGIEEQAVQVLDNLVEVLKEAGCGLNKVLKTTIYLANMDDFAIVNEIYGRYFDFDVKPARATVEVSRLPKNVLLEIDAIAEV